MHLNAPRRCSYMQQFCRAKSHGPQRHINAWRWNDRRDDLLDLVLCFPTLPWDKKRKEPSYFHVLADRASSFCYANVLQEFSSHSSISQVPPMWIPVPWHRFSYLSGAAATRAPSAWLISFILVASKEARGCGEKGASIAALLVQKRRRSLSCAVRTDAGDTHVCI